MVEADSHATAPSAANESPSILSKAFDLLRAFDSSNRVMTLSELAQASGLPKSTVHRLLGRLVELEAIEHHGTAGYKIGLSLLRIGSVSPALSMRDIAMPYLTSLQHWTGQAVYLGVLRQFDVVYLEKLEPPHFAGSPATVGGRLPANCTAIGKALLSYEDFDDLAMFLPSPLPALTTKSITSIDTLIEQLRQVRRLGLAQERNEARDGLACLAAPIVERGYAVGALSVAHPAAVPRDPRTSSAIRDTAARIAKELRAWTTAERAHWFPKPD